MTALLSGTLTSVVEGCAFGKMVFVELLLPDAVDSAARSMECCQTL